MKILKDAIAKDLWTVLLDLVAVNASYYLALLIRFYVNFQLRPVAVDKYLPAWIGFTPYYSVLSILIFMCWRLYGGLWRYAGINDMNRIIPANLCTSALHILGTTIFFTRMPVTYYVIGGVLQFVFVVIIRFAYRALMVEKKKLAGRRQNKTNAIVVGAGENGRRVVKHLEESEVFRPVAVIASVSGGLMDGLPILDADHVEWEKIGAVFIADPLLTTKEREKIKDKCKEADIELQDYTGFYTNLGGKLSLTELLATITSPLTVCINGKEENYPNGEEALKSLVERYQVTRIEGPVRITLEKQKRLSAQEALMLEYAAVMGGEPPQ